MAPPIPVGLAEKWQQIGGFDRALDAYFVTCLLPVDMHLLVKLLSPVLGNGCHLELIQVPTEEPNQQPWISAHFQGKLTLRAETRTRTMCGSYLRVLNPYKAETGRQSAEDSLQIAANQLRLRFGLAAAFEVAEVLDYDLDSGVSSRESAAHYVAAAGDGRSGNPLVESEVLTAGFEQETFALRPDVSLLMSEALANNNRRHRYLLLWMAIEAQLGNGAERKRFCEMELHSPTISAEMKRLHDIRSALVHGRGAVDDGMSPERLLDVIRIATLSPGQARTELVRLLEQQLGMETARRAD